MISVATPRQMAVVDERCAREFAIPTQKLMEEAAGAVARTARAMVPPGGRVLALCGSGNNGGDGLAAARLLLQDGIKTKVCLAAEPAPGSLAAAQLDRFVQAGGEVLGPEALAGKQADLVIDALLGTGLTRDVSGPYMQLIEWMNSQPTPVLAVDIPSGVDGMTGQVRGGAVKAAQTVALAGYKPGNLLYPGRALCGRQQVADIGVPPSLLGALPGAVWQQQDVARALPPRPAHAHKGDFGHAVVVGGSLGMMGAGALASAAAMVSGAGLTTWAHPDVPVPPLPWGVMTRPCRQRGGRFTAGAAAGLLGLLQDKSVLALGPGLGRGPQVTELVKRLVARAAMPMVVDADGLNALADGALTVRDKQPMVLTPHPGEMARLWRCTVADVLARPVGTALDAARQFGAVVLLKGATTVIADPGGALAYNLTGNPGMAKGGSGDVLTGVIAGLMAQGMGPWEAACAGAWVHGRAGDIASRRWGSRSMTPTDTVDALPDVFLALEGGEL